MHEKVRAYLEAEREKQAAAERRDREETLLRLGLWEKDYEPEEAPDPARYPEKDKDGRRWRKAPLPVTDGEWEEIRRCAGRDREHWRSGWSAALWVFSGSFFIMAAVTLGAAS